ncbi:VMAP-C domain-containing protein [Nocardiopsis suaedae]|uniref:Trypsin-like peptidase domain-containing protein n=1 Tax=Nocardiopsis suaedae TaxID=3018444 RepID=A0ABT4TN82_9ACTN|nr:trypsin-like peptidase domain-containing protein [Nocardiopsis suaedae]MDA2805821.1 trypsin-like peptidase domain-containing protein [Nocardiopsis suaedae]
MDGLAGPREVVVSAHPWALRILTRDRGTGQADAIGTGVLLPGNRALTCAHVVEAVRGGATVAVDSPGFDTHWCSEVGDVRTVRQDRADFALLTLETPAPSWMQSARLQRIGPFDRRQLSTCGYPAGGDAAIWFYHWLGEFGGRPGHVQMLRQPSSPGIMPGCSGSGVRDDLTNAVVGLLVSSWEAGEAGGGVAFMLPVDAVIDALPDLADCLETLDTAEPAPDPDGDLPPEASRQAHRLLSQIRPHRLGTLVRMAAPSGDTLLRGREPRDTVEAFEALLDRNAPLSGVPPYLFFADLVLAEAEAGRADTGSGVRPLRALRAWVGDQAERLELLERQGASRVRAALAERRARLTEPGEGHGHVLLRIEREGDRPDDARRRLSAWRSGPEEWLPERVVDAVVPMGGLAERAVRAIVEAETGWLEEQETDPLVEIALPVEFLDLEVERWPYPVHGADAPWTHGPTVPLGIRHDVVVRGVTRPRTSKVRWRSRWARLQDPLRPRVHWVPASSEAGPDSATRVYIALEQDNESTLVVLGPGIGTDLGAAAMGSALISGYPYLLWDRRGPLDDEFRREFEAAMEAKAAIEAEGASGARLVREAVRHLRRTGRRADDGSGDGPHRRIVLFHEDPHRPLPSIAPAACVRTER